MIRMILDTDPGVDDTMAIAYAHLHPAIELIALTTVFGNTSITNATRNARYVLDRLGANDTAVVEGAAAPLAQPKLPYADFVHGADGLGECYPAAGVTLRSGARHANAERVDAAEFILQATREAPGEITLVAVGPLTNIAEALARDPALPRRVRELVVMGGTVIEPGNVSPVAEANFLNDPHAADAVLGADWPATVVGLDVTHRIMLSDTDLGHLRDHAGDAGQFIWDTSRFYVDFYTRSRAAIGERGGEPGCAMHDAAAIACVLIPDAFTRQTGAARVVQEGVAVGQLALDRTGYDYLVPHWRDRPATSVCLSVDATRVRQAFLDAIVAGGALHS